MTKLPMLLLVVLLCACGDQPPATSGVLTVEPPEATVAIGKPGGVSSRQIRFQLKNSGGQPLTIKQVEPACCQRDLAVAQGIAKLTLQPGEATELVLRATPPAIGKFERVVNLHTDVSTSPVQITVKFVGEEIRPPYILGAARPQDLELVSSQGGATVERDMSLVAIERAAGALWIEAISSNSSSVSAKRIGQPEELQIEDGIVRRQYTFRVTAIIPDSADLPIAAAMDIKVRAPSHLPVHGFLAFARLIKSVRVVPAQLLIRGEPAAAFPIERKILVIPADGGHKRFALASALPEWLNVAEDPDTEHLPHGAQRFLVRVNRPGDGASVSDATVELQAAEDGSTTVTVPVRLSTDGES